MTRLGRVYAIALILTKSQLRAGRSRRSGESFFRNPAILALIDGICFVACAIIGLALAGIILALPPSQEAPLVAAIKESLVFVPVLVPSVVLVAGVLFELSASSKFASSDAINWLPVTQAEYVAASTLSVAYAYSVVPSVIMGLTFGPSVKLGYGGTWVEMLLLSCVSLFYGGAIVEILRAAINRVSSVVMGRARRGALVLRLAATIGVILVVEVIFNFVFLIELVGSFTSVLNAVEFLPVLWASLAVRASLVGDTAQNAIFAAATLLFSGGMLWAAIKVRAMYWSPTPSQVTVTGREYAPDAGSPFFSLFGLSSVEATLVRKDIRGLTRRRELLSYFAIPFVLGIVFVFQIFFNPSLSSGTGGAAQATSATGQLPIWFVGGLFGLIISSISFGQEQRSASLLYSLPVTAKQVLRAKIFTSMLLAMLATVGIFAVVTVIARPPPLVTLENFVIAVAITAQEVCIGTAFGAKYPDFQERPRPRFVDPFGIIVMVIVGMVVIVITALPSIASDALTSFPGVQSQVRPLFLASVAFAVAVIGLSYRWANRETKKLFVEFKW
jgi:Putative ATP-binding cassette